MARHVILNVVVTDASGKPVSGLQEKEFTLFDNHQRQQIVSFQGVEGRTAKQRFRLPAAPGRAILILCRLFEGGI